MPVWTVPSVKTTWPADFVRAGHVPAATHEEKSVLDPFPVTVFVGIVTAALRQLPEVLQEYVSV